MVLFLRSKTRFCYIPENESEQDILGWNKSQELNTCSHIELTSSIQWDPVTIDLHINKVQTTKYDDQKVKIHVSVVSISSRFGDSLPYKCNNLLYDENILHKIEPHIVFAKEKQLKQTNFYDHTDTNDLPDRRTFVS